MKEWSSVLLNYSSESTQPTDIEPLDLEIIKVLRRIDEGEEPDSALLKARFFTPFSSLLPENRDSITARLADMATRFDLLSAIELVPAACVPHRVGISIQHRSAFHAANLRN